MNRLADLVTRLDQLHEVLERIDGRLEQLTRQTDLQRETLDAVLVNVMEIADQGK